MLCNFATVITLSSTTDVETHFFEPKEYDPSDVLQMKNFLRHLNSIIAHGGGNGPEFWMHQQHATTTTTTTINQIGAAQHDAAINATCVRGHHFPYEMVAPYTSCIDCCIVLCSSYLVDGGGGGCSCMLLVHPVLTRADAGPDLCTLCPDLCTLLYSA